MSGVLSENGASGAPGKRASLRPVEFDEFLRDLVGSERQPVAGVRAAEDGEVGEHVQQGELVGRDELPFFEDSLQVLQELELERSDGRGRLPLICAPSTPPSPAAPTAPRLSGRGRRP